MDTDYDRLWFGMYTHGPMSGMIHAYTDPHNPDGMAPMSLCKARSTTDLSYEYVRPCDDVDVTAFITKKYAETCSPCIRQIEHTATSHIVQMIRHTLTRA